MRRTGILYLRELSASFASPVTWILLGIVWLLFGLLYWRFMLPGYGGDLLAMTWHAAQTIAWFQVFTAPILTMRLISEEKRSGTLEMLVTAPTRDHEIVLAKFASALTVNLVMWLIIPVYGLIMMLAGGEPDFGPVFTSYLVIEATGALFLAAGVFASALGSNQILAAFLGIIFCFVIYLSPQIAGALPRDLELIHDLADAANLSKHIEEAARGLLDLVHIVFHVVFAGLFLLFTIRALEVRKWA